MEITPGTKVMDVMRTMMEAMQEDAKTVSGLNRSFSV